MAALRGFCFGLLMAGSIHAAAAADLVVWWTRGYYPEEDEGIRRIVAGFERETGRTVELSSFTQDDLPTKAIAALTAGQPPDLAYCVSCFGHFARWAHDGVLLDLTEVIGPLAERFDRDSLERARYQGPDDERRYYTFPIVRASVHIHVWKSLLEQAGLTLADIPTEWDAFWSFWCDTVQPAVRRATGKARVYGVGQLMSTSGNDTRINFFAFLFAHNAYFVDGEGRLLFDEPGVRARIVAAVEDYVRPAKRGCNPPGAATWGDADNNVSFLNQTIVMTSNPTLSIPASQRSSNPDNYNRNIATIDWPRTLDGKPLTFLALGSDVVIFAEGRDPEGAKAFVRHVMRPEHLGPYVEAAQGRWFPPMPELAETPFWTDGSDPHRAVLKRQLTTNPTTPLPDHYDWRYQQVLTDKVWEKAIGRVVLEGWDAGAAVDEAIARTRQIVGR